VGDVAKRLVGPTLITAITSGTAQTLYTVAASTKTIVRDILVANNDSVDRAITLSIGADAVGTRLLPAIVVPANGVLSRTGSIVLEATETLRSFGSVASQLTLTISGVEIT